MTKPVPNIVCYVQNPPTPYQETLVRKFKENGLFPMVDSVHSTIEWSGWFKSNFKESPHRAYYNDPYLMNGDIENIDMNISGVPHFIIYFKNDVEFDILNWLIVTKYVNFILNGVDQLSLQDLIDAKEIFQLPTEGTLLKSSNDEEIPVDEHVIISKPENYYYSFESRHYVDEDRMICTICRPDHVENRERPFLVILDNYEKEGYKNLFKDLYSSPDWGGGMDNSFMAKLWKELEMVGEFFPPKSPPKDCINIYRSTIEELFKVNEFGLKFFF
jgi:hypothetical protein